MVRRLSEPLGAFRAVFANANLRRLELAWAGSIVSEWAYGIAVLVFADAVGGASLVGGVAAIRAIAAAGFAPLSGLIADRFSRERAIVATNLVRSAALLLAGGAYLMRAPAVGVFFFTVIGSVVSTAFRPAQAALTPSLAGTPEELTASSVFSSTTESVGIFAGPAIGGLLQAATSPGAVFAAAAGCFLWAGLLVSRIHAEPPKRVDERAPGRPLAGALAGFRIVSYERTLRLIVGVFAAEMLVCGAFNVLVVAVAIELLKMGEAGPGLLTAAVGVGGVLAALPAASLVGRRLMPGLGLGMLLWGIPIACVGIWPQRAPTLLFLGAIGVGNTLVGVAAFTLMERVVTDEVLARVFGALESLAFVAIGVGGIVGSVLIETLGIRAALGVTGSLLPLLVALFWQPLARADRVATPARGLALLRGVNIFAPLPVPVLEHLANSLAPVTLSAGETVFSQGDPGDRFYVVAEGEVEVFVDGEYVRRQGPGEHFGEIALLRDTPRTATVKASEDSELYALERDEFIAAVTGHPPSAQAADAVIGARLARARPEVASL